MPDAKKHIIKKLPSMYHQFKQLADIDITTAPMEVRSDDALHHGRIRVDGESQSSTLPGSSRPANVPPGCTARIG